MYKSITFIGDASKLEAVLSDLPEDTYLVFLGDINDTSKPSLSSRYSLIECYNRVRLLVDSGRATLIHSNHQRNLIRTLSGERTKVSRGMINTLLDLRDADWIEFELNESETHLTHLEIREEYAVIGLMDWLLSRPLYFSHILDDDRVLIGVHAQFDVELDQSRSKFRNTCLYGSKLSNGGRNP